MQYLSQLSAFLAVVLLYLALCEGDGQSDVTRATCLDYDETNPDTACEGGYRILAKIDGVAYIGGRNELVAVKLDNSTESTSVTVDTCYSNSPVACLRITSTDKEDDCVNYIRSVIPLNGRLYVCGTNALLPRCFFCDYTDSPNMQLSCDFIGNDEAASDTSCLTNYPDATNIFPSLGTVNASSYLSGNNKLYVGVATDPRTKTKVEIASKSLNTATGALGSDRVTTRVNNEREVFDADLVGPPFEKGDRIYFMFRETAAEYADQVQDQNVGNEIYSRIARVCADDDGLLVGTAQIWTSYQKIRLECAEENPTGYLNYFNEIQDFVYNETEGIIYAIFTNDRNAPARSALCKYNLTYIDDIFDNSDFFGPDTSKTNPEWTVSVGPTPRPGFKCSNPSQDTDFTRDYPLMATDAKNDEYDLTATDVKPPSLILDDYRFSSLDISNGYYYIATESGSIIKVSVTDPLGDCMMEYSVSDEAIKDIMKTDEVGEIFVIATSHSVTCQNLPYVGYYKLPSEDNISVKPNTVVSITYAARTTTCLRNTTVVYENGTAVHNSLFNEESLQCDTTTTKIMRVNIRVLGNINVTFGTEYINPTHITTYHKYTTYECDSRCTEWEEMNNAYTVINAQMMQGTPYTFERRYVADQTQTCDQCTYYDCSNHTDTCSAQSTYYDCSNQTDTCSAP